LWWSESAEPPNARLADSRWFGHVKNPEKTARPFLNRLQRVFGTAINRASAELVNDRQAVVFKPYICMSFVSDDGKIPGWQGQSGHMCVRIGMCGLEDYLRAGLAG
jgi:hypothetical protein